MNSRSIAIGILGFLTLILGVASVYIGLQVLQEDTAPDESDASGTVPGGGNDDPAIDTPGVDDCFIDNPSVTDAFITINEFCDPSRISNDARYQEAVPAGTTSAECVGINANRTDLNAAPGGTYRPDGGCGQCVQIDLVYTWDGGTVPFGTAAYTGDCPVEPICGDGVVDPGEQCDDGNNIDTDACSNSCTTNTVTCYRCTVQEGDGDACESITVDGSGCPAGYTTNSNCAEEIGGSCEDTPLLCGGSCLTNEQCPTGNVCSGGACVLATCLEDGINCSMDLCEILPPEELPDTSLFDDDTNRLLLGMLLLIAALITTQVNIFESSSNMLKTLNNGLGLDTSPDSKKTQKVEKSQTQKSKFSKSRNRFEKKISKRRNR